MHHLLLLAVLLACLTLASLQNATDNLTTSSRMSEVLHMANTYPSPRVHQQFKPLALTDPLQMGTLGSLGAGQMMMGTPNWHPQRSHQQYPQYHHHFPAHVPGSPIVPLAVSFSVGYLLFRLLALGAIFLEKEFSPSYGYGNWKMQDTKLDHHYYGRSALNSNTLMHLMEQVHKALDKYSPRRPL